jgi:hypothetical protein
MIVLSTGLFTGLLMTVKFFFERALKDLSGPEFALVMRRFLKITRTHPLNYAMVLTSGFAPIAGLVMLRGTPGDPSVVLTAIGLLAFSLRSWAHYGERDTCRRSSCRAPRYGLPFSTFVLLTMACPVPLTWVYLHTRGSVPIATLPHGAVNLSRSFFLGGARRRRPRARVLASGCRVRCGRPRPGGRGKA